MKFGIDIDIHLDQGLCLALWQAVDIEEIVDQTIDLNRDVGRFATNEWLDAVRDGRLGMFGAPEKTTVHLRMRDIHDRKATRLFHIVLIRAWLEIGDESLKEALGRALHVLDIVLNISVVDQLSRLATDEGRTSIRR